MKQHIIILLFVCSSLSLADQMDSTATKQDSTIEKSNNSPSKESKWYYGGNIGFSFWTDYFYFSVAPLVGYKVTPQFSVGGKIGYSYSSDSSVDPTFNSSNYGGSIFTRYRIIPQFYLHGEFVYASYEKAYRNSIGGYTTERNWVPYLLLGGGFSQMIGTNVWAYVEVLFDVLQDPNSPYEDWDPIISLGVG